MLENQETKLHRNEKEFQWAQRDFVNYMKEVIYWQKMKLIRSTLNFLTIVFVILLCFSHRKILYASLMTFDDIPQV